MFGFFSTKKLSRRIQTRPVRSPEQLETRVLLAGNMAAILQGGNLLLIGNSASNNVEIRPNGGGGISVFGTSGTKINGSNAPFPIDGDTVFSGNITVLAGKGDDTVHIDSITVGGDVGMVGAKGNDVILVESSVVNGRLTAAMGQGEDGVGVDASTIGGKTSALLGGGNDLVIYHDAWFQSDTFTTGGSGNDLIGFDNVLATGRTRIVAGGGNDAVVVDGGSYADQLFANGGGGNDTLFMNPGLDSGIVTRRFETILP